MSIQTMNKTASPFSDRVLGVDESLTVATFARMGELKREGADLISLVAGEPDFDTPENIKKAAIQAIERGCTKYTAPASGLPELRQAIAHKLKRENNLDYDPSQIVVTCGAKQVIFDAVVALINPGDEAIIPSPFWVSYADQVRLMGGRPVILRTSGESGFRLTPRALADAITSRTKVILLNSPCNPTGEVYTPGELCAIADVIADAGIFVISDEIYEKIIYDPARHVSIAAVHPDVVRRTLIVNGFSKAYAMTGWRVGYGAGPPELMRLIAKVQSQETTNTCTISQYAAIEALTGTQESVDAMRDEFRKRRDLIVERLNCLPGVSCRLPQGAFYAFPDVAGLFGERVRNDVELANYLLEEAMTGCVPGSGFGSGNHLRFSYAASLPMLHEAMDRIEDAVSRI
ncbi:MAG: pyridoxal phosphate-dependent aminotransferase [Gemmatimonadota bacterium]|nr:pyridoxal phosphate-dependent aminotransferase [Gemmatimonadota bacterium]